MHLIKLNLAAYLGGLLGLQLPDQLALLSHPGVDTGGGGGGEGRGGGRGGGGGGGSGRGSWGHTRLVVQTGLLFELSL